MLSIKNEQAGDLTEINDDSLINANGLGTPTSMPFKKSFKKEKVRKTQGEKKKDDKQDPYAKDLNSMKSQSLFSNYYSGTLFFHNSFFSLKQRQEGCKQFEGRTFAD